jgi:hypothetical protein
MGGERMKKSTKEKAITGNIVHRELTTQRV